MTQWKHEIEVLSPCTYCTLQSASLFCFWGDFGFPGVPRLTLLRESLDLGCGEAACAGDLSLLFGAYFRPVSFGLLHGLQDVLSVHGDCTDSLRFPVLTWQTPGTLSACDLFLPGWTVELVIFWSVSWMGSRLTATGSEGTTRASLTIFATKWSIV